MIPPNSLTPILEKLYGRINYERQSNYGLSDLKLQNMQRLLQQLGNPHLKYPIVHIAGTKGKGSVAAMMGKVLAETGRKTGVYTSPHLEKINQRIAINGIPISDDDLETDLGLVDQAAAELDSNHAADPNYRNITFFEAITATGFLHFAKQRVDVAVIEVGMGGRLDSTNVCQPQLSIITSISFDHTQHLGNTLAQIATEKAGIIKTGVPAISGVREPEPMATIAEIANQKSSRLYQLGIDFEVCPSMIQNPSRPETGGCFSVSLGFDQPKICIENLTTRMLGKHQQHNAALVVAASALLNRQGWQIPEAAMRDGIAEAYSPGRTEIIGHSPTIMLDIAHNSASVEALVATLDELPHWKECPTKVLILAISKDKKYQEILEKLISCFDVILFTRFKTNPRCRPPEQLLAQAQRAKLEFGCQPQMKIIDDPQQACTEAKNLAGPTGFVCVAGSAFLIAEVRPGLKKAVQLQM